MLTYCHILIKEGIFAHLLRPIKFTIKVSDYRADQIREQRVSNTTTIHYKNAVVLLNEK